MAISPPIHKQCAREAQRGFVIPRMKSDHEMQQKEYNCAATCPGNLERFVEEADRHKRDEVTKAENPGLSTHTAINRQS